MIESSVAVVLLGFGFFYFRSADTKSKYSHIQWVVIAIRSKRDTLEAKGRIGEANKLSELADELSQGVGRIFHKISRDSDSNKRTALAIMTINREDFLGKLGLYSESGAFLPTRNALYWLVNKFS